MAIWTTEQLDAIGKADELRIVAPSRQGNTDSAVPIWVVRVNDELFVRAYRGPSSRWYRRALAAGAAHIRAGGIAVDVSVHTPGLSVQDAIDAEYRRKYARFGSAYVEPMIAAGAHAATLSLIPADPHERKAS